MLLSDIRPFAVRCVRNDDEFTNDLFDIICAAVLLRAKKPSMMVDSLTTSFDPRKLFSMDVMTMAVNATEQGILLPVMCEWAMVNPKPLLDSLDDHLRQYLPRSSVVVDRLLLQILSCYNPSQ
jgi:phage gp37-like protein